MQLSYLECIGGIVDKVDAEIVERHGGYSADRCEDGYLEQFDSLAGRARRLSD